MAEATTQLTTIQAPGTGGFMPGMSNLGIIKQVGLMVGLAASVALGVVIALWAQTPDMKPMGSFDSTSMAEAVSFLEQSKIPYKLADNGTLMVAQDQFQQAQLALASQGISQGSGDDFLKKDSGFGVSQRLESARLVRNQEQQLMRSIEQFSGVRKAQVHLAIPKQSSFVGTRKSSSASVVLSLYNRGRLDSGQAQAIVDLVSGAIPNLDNNHVSVSDQYGRLYHSGEMNSSAQATEREFAAETKRQQELSHKIESLLSPILGPENFTVQVNVDLDFTQSSQTQKILNPDLSVITHEKKFETQSTTADTDGGIAGALSNQPPAAAIIPEDGNAEPLAAQKKPGNSRIETDRSYEIDTTISHTRQQIGMINRLTVSVGVNYTDDPDNAGTRIAMPQSQLDKISRLVQGVIGYDVQRGDQIMVDSFEFIVAEPPPEAAPLEFYQQPLFAALWKPVVALLGIVLLIFVVLKPVMSKLSTAPPQLAPAEGYPMLDTMAATNDNVDEFQAPTEMSQISRAKSLVGNDPKQVAALVQNWVATDE